MFIGDKWKEVTSVSVVKVEVKTWKHLECFRIKIWTFSRFLKVLSDKLLENLHSYAEWSVNFLSSRTGGELVQSFSGYAGDLGVVSSSPSMTVHLVENGTFVSLTHGKWNNSFITHGKWNNSLSYTWKKEQFLLFNIRSISLFTFLQYFSVLSRFALKPKLQHVY